MAKASPKTPPPEFRTLPWKRLVLSEKNVRHITEAAADTELAEDIANRGVLQSLVVCPQIGDDGTDTGIFEVIAGGRRYGAVGRLIAQKRMPADIALPCLVRRAGIAEEDSLAENVQRAPLHVLDQLKAFSALMANGLSEDEIAARFFVPVSVVRQRLKLVTVSPVILEAYGRDEMRLETLMAFTVNPDHQRQEQVWEAAAQNAYSRDPYQIRRALTENTVKATDKRALFVGAEAYIDAGGIIARDLFEADNGGWLQNPALLDRLVTQKLQDHIQDIAGEGWKWAEVAVDFGYGHTHGLRQLIGTQTDLSDEEKIELSALTDEFDRLTAEHEDADELPDDIDQRFGELEEKIETFQNRPLQFDPNEVSRAGVFLSITANGLLRIERGYVRPEDEPPSEIDSALEGDGSEGDHSGAGETIGLNSGNNTALPTDDSDDDEHGVKPLPDRLVTELTAYRTLALRNAVANQPRVAMTLLLHKLCSDQFYRRGDGLCLDARIYGVGLFSYGAGLNDSPPAEAINARNRTWAEDLPADEKTLWVWLDALDDVSRLALLAHCISYGVNALYQKPDRYGGSGPSAHTIEARMRNADLLASAVALDLAAAGWRPNVANYLGIVSKAHILKAVDEAKGEAAASRIDHLKKGDMAAEAAQLLDGTGWLPECLRTPDLAEKVDPAIPTVTDDTEGHKDPGAPDEPEGRPSGLEAAE